MGKLAQLRLKGTPSKKQLEFFGATSRFVAYGGARGGGKSWALRRKLVLMCIKWEGISALLVRRSYPELRENHIRPLQSELSGIAKYNETQKTFTFPNGSRIRLGYLESESDVLRYQGAEFDIIALDEATQLTEYQFQTLKACLRGTNGLPKRMYITCNPGGVGHGWVKRLFIDRDYRAGEKSEDYSFIQALVFDNDELMKQNPDYLSQLESLPEELRRAWLFGRWDVFAGQFFPEFDSDVHVTEKPVPDGSIRYVAMDYGLDMFAAVFVAVDKNGEAYVYDELCEKNLIVSEAAQRLRKRADGQAICAYIAPKDLWSRQKDTGKSISELFCENGVPLTKVGAGRAEGWLALKEWLKVSVDADKNKHSAMTISRACADLIAYLPRLMYDPKNPNDCSTEPHEITHVTDALRYFAVFRNSVPHETAPRHSEKLASKLQKKHRLIYG